MIHRTRWLPALALACVLAAPSAPAAAVLVCQNGTKLKLREACKATENLALDLSALDAIARQEAPRIAVYSFSGRGLPPTLERGDFDAAVDGEALAAEFETTAPSSTALIQLSALCGFNVADNSGIHVSLEVDGRPATPVRNPLFCNAFGQEATHFRGSLVAAVDGLEPGLHTLTAVITVGGSTDAVIAHFSDVYTAVTVVPE